MSGCSSTSCCLCLSKFNKRRHFHSNGWSDAMQSFFQERVTCHKSVCVCSACERNLRHCYKNWKDGVPYKFRWLKEEKLCSIPSCKSKEIKACKHGFTWEDICSFVGVSSVETYTDIELPLCSQHYQLV